jgi:hypothetical protein
VKNEQENRDSWGIFNVVGDHADANFQGLGTEIVDSADDTARFRFDPNILRYESKNNELRFHFPDARKPGNEDERVMAIALRSVQFL